MKALEINEVDALSVEVAWRSSHDDEHQHKGYVAVPDLWADAKKITLVRTKYYKFARLEFSDSTQVRIKAIEDELPDVASETAIDLMNYEKVNEDDLSWWKDYKN